MATGYTDCACRDCFEIAFDGGFCHECEEAGCEDYQGVEGMSQECQVDEPEYEESDRFYPDPLVPANAVDPEAERRRNAFDPHVIVQGQDDESITTANAAENGIPVY